MSSSKAAVNPCLFSALISWSGFYSLVSGLANDLVVLSPFHISNYHLSWSCVSFIFQIIIHLGLTLGFQKLDATSFIHVIH